ncbi:MAG: histidine phosphatase family protein [Haloarculaceae archaeon]
MRLTAVRRAQIDPFDPDRPPAAYDLTERGRVQARLLGARLARENPPDAVYTGDSDRHRDTAAVVAGTVEAITGDRPPVETDAGLDDVAWTMDALLTCHEDGLPQVEWSRRWAAGDLPIEEDVTAVRDRVCALADRLADDRDPDASLLVVTSAVPIQVLASAALGIDLATARLPVANAARFAFDWAADRRTVEALNDAAHLPGALATRDGFVDRD